LGVDENPYEPPRVPEPQRTAHVVKQGVGLATIVVLTPVAVGVAGFVSCNAAMAYANPPFSDMNFLGAFTLAFLPPLVVLVGMIWWAVASYRRSVLPNKRPPSE
jgi:hypothetical protein